MKIYTLRYRHGISGANWKSWGSDKSDAWKIHMKIKFGRGWREKMTRHGSWMNKVWWVVLWARTFARKQTCNFTFYPWLGGMFSMVSIFFWFTRWYSYNIKKCRFYFGRLIIIIKCVHVHNVRSSITPIEIAFIVRTWLSNSITKIINQKEKSM